MPNHDLVETVKSELSSRLVQHAFQLCEATREPYIPLLYLSEGVTYPGLYVISM